MTKPASKPTYFISCLLLATALSFAPAATAKKAQAQTVSAYQTTSPSGLMANTGQTGGVIGGSFGRTIPSLMQRGIAQQAPTSIYGAEKQLEQQLMAQPLQANVAPVMVNPIQPVSPQDWMATAPAPIMIDPAFQNAPAVPVIQNNSFAGDFVDNGDYQTQIVKVPVPVYQPAMQQQQAPQPTFMQPIMDSNTQYVGANTPLSAPMAQANGQVSALTSPLPDYNNGYNAGGEFGVDRDTGIDRSIMPSPLFTPSRRTTQSINAQPYQDIPAQPGLAFEIDQIDDLGSETLITRKIGDMRGDLNKLQEAIAIAKEQLEKLRYSAELQAADYYAVVAAIQARLQAGSTPGNPRLVNSWNIAQDRLDRLSEDIDSLGGLATKVAAQANLGKFLLEASRATYGLSGALESDHALLEVLEDDATNTILVINRLLNESTDDINRRTAYLSAERKNLQSLAVGITNGELFGRSLTNQYFRRVTDPTSAAGLQRLRSEGKRPLAVIRFNQDNVNYQQPVYAALNDAIRANPDTQFEIIAIAPNEGTSAELALASTDAKQKAENVVRTLSNMGLPNARMQVSSSMSTEADTTEVHIYVR